MPDVMVTETMAADPTSVYALVSDVTRIGRYSPETFEAEWLDGATGPAVGAKFRGHVKRNQKGPTYWTTCTVVASEPILHLGAGAPEAKPKAGYDFAFATFEVDAAGKGTAGDLAPAAKLKVGPNDAVVVDDYGAEAVRLTGISTK